MENEWTNNKNIRGSILILAAILSIFFVAKTIKEIKGFNDGDQEHIISVGGYGEVAAVPDATSFSYAVVETGKTVAEAQTKATDKSNAIIAYLKDSGIEDKDIKTENYSINPQYEFQRQVCSGGICPPGRQVISGYEVNQTVYVKVRDNAKAGDILTAIGSKGASNVSGLSFTIDLDRQEELQAEARAIAIAQAREKAEVMAKALGVRLGDIASFNEGGSQPFPMYEMKAVDGRGSANQAVAPILPTGENKVISNVTVTFEIH
jgi:uncharacterized protein